MLFSAKLTFTALLISSVQSAPMSGRGNPTKEMEGGMTDPKPASKMKTPEHLKTSAEMDQLLRAMEERRGPAIKQEYERVLRSLDEDSKAKRTQAIQEAINREHERVMKSLGGNSSRSSHPSSSSNPQKD